MGGIALSGLTLQAGVAYQTRVVVAGLSRPTGIAAQGSGTLFITQLPTPGVPGSAGGENTVDRIQLGSGRIVNLTTGEPEPTNLTLDKHGNLYWTCKSAGVILRRNAQGNVSLLLSGLAAPTGIALDHQGRRLYFTEVPTPGVAGGMGGLNAVWAYDLETGDLDSVDLGDPEPTDITVAPNGRVYWTCSSAGVIVEATPANH
jgi:sugar lactone lactonase YvrE